MSERRRSRRKGSEAQTAPQGRQVDYVRLKNPFPSMNAFSDDRIEAMHQASLEILETDGVKILLPEARALFKAGGAKVDVIAGPPYPELADGIRLIKLPSLQQKRLAR